MALVTTSGTDKEIEARRVDSIIVGVARVNGKRMVGFLLMDEDNPGKEQLVFYARTKGDIDSIIGDIVKMRDVCWPDTPEAVLASFKSGME